ncbi:putative ribonuclease H protein [Corchorus olitorius]|uniref:Ribonuclease H protein n=1 Tax=Corchorus olitorius TaxID=93759 RepID=A0A1R3KZM3_9ROSI|nr:putative ribonuclease H protein [Corchorus olitorius]
MAFNDASDELLGSHLQSSGCDSWFTLSLVTEWAIWKDRNLELHEGKKARPPTTVHLIVALTQEYGQAQTIHGPTVVLSDLPCGPPPEGTVKLNFDPSFCEKDHRGGIGVVARDHRGLPLGCLAERIAGLYNPFVAEMIAALGGNMKLKPTVLHDLIRGRPTTDADRVKLNTEGASRGNPGVLGLTL